MYSCDPSDRIYVAPSLTTDNVTLYNLSDLEFAVDDADSAALLGPNGNPVLLRS